MLNMVEELGSEILTDPTEVIAFVGSTLDVGDGGQKRQQRRAGTRDRHTGQAGMRLEDLRIVDEDEDGPDLDDVEEIEREFGLDSGIGASGKDEMVLTALTLLLAVLEGESRLCVHSVPPN